MSTSGASAQSTPSSRPGAAVDAQGSSSTGECFTMQQPQQPRQRVLVIGAGIAGLQAAAALVKAGHKITVLEELRDVGGCWLTCSPDAKLQAPCSYWAFPDFPWPSTLQPPPGVYPTARQVLAYCQAYAEFHDLLPHIRFGCRVLKVVEEKERSKGAPGAGGQGDPWSSVLGAGVRWRAVFRDLESRKHLQISAAFLVIATGLYSSPYKPSYPGQSGFLGRVLHAADLPPPGSGAGLDVLIVGCSKSPLDTAAAAAVARSARSVSLMYHKWHWPVTPGKGSDIFLSRRIDALQEVPYYTATSRERMAHTLSKPLRRATAARVQGALQARFAIGQGGAGTPVPDVPLAQDLLLTGAHTVEPRDWEAVAGHPCVQALGGRVRCFTPEGVLLDTGAEVPADLVLFCTGFTQSFKYLDQQVTHRLQICDDGLFLYRSMIHPDVGGLAFVGCGADTMNSIVTGALQAQWLARLLDGSVVLPDRAAMQEDLMLQQRWKRSIMAASHNRAARYAHYTHNYHDQLLEDMSVPTRSPAASPFSCFSSDAAAIPSAYTSLYHEVATPAQATFALEAADLLRGRRTLASLAGRGDLEAGGSSSQATFECQEGRPPGDIRTSLSESGADILPGTVASQPGSPSGAGVTTGSVRSRMSDSGNCLSSHTAQRTSVPQCGADGKAGRPPPHAAGCMDAAGLNNKGFAPGMSATMDRTHLLNRPLQRFSMGSVLELDEAALARLAILRSSTTTSQSQMSTACPTNVTSSHIQGLLDAGGSTQPGASTAGNGPQAGAGCNVQPVPGTQVAAIGLDMLAKALMSQEGGGGATWGDQLLHPSSPPAVGVPGAHVSADHALMASGKRSHPTSTDLGHLGISMLSVPGGGSAAQPTTSQHPASSSAKQEVTAAHPASPAPRPPTKNANAPAEAPVQTLTTAAAPEVLPQGTSTSRRLDASGSHGSRVTARQSSASRVGSPSAFSATQGSAAVATGPSAWGAPHKAGPDSVTGPSAPLSWGRPGLRSAQPSSPDFSPIYMKPPPEPVVEMIGPSPRVLAAQKAAAAAAAAGRIAVSAKGAAHSGGLAHQTHHHQYPGPRASQSGPLQLASVREHDTPPHLPQQGSNEVLRQGRAAENCSSQTKSTGTLARQAYPRTSRPSGGKHRPGPTGSKTLAHLQLMGSARERPRTGGGRRKSLSASSAHVAGLEELLRAERAGQSSMSFTSGEVGRRPSRLSSATGPDSPAKQHSSQLRTQSASNLAGLAGVQQAIRNFGRPALQHPGPTAAPTSTSGPLRRVTFTSSPLCPYGTPSTPSDPPPVQTSSPGNFVGPSALSTSEPLYPQPVQPFIRPDNAVTDPTMLVPDFPLSPPSNGPPGYPKARPPVSPGSHASGQQAAAGSSVTPGASLPYQQYMPGVQAVLGDPALSPGSVFLHPPGPISSGRLSVASGSSSTPWGGGGPSSVSYMQRTSSWGTGNTGVTLSPAVSNPVPPAVAAASTGPSFTQTSVTGTGLALSPAGNSFTRAAYASMGSRSSRGSRGSRGSHSVLGSQVLLAQQNVTMAGDHSLPHLAGPLVSPGEDGVAVDMVPVSGGQLVGRDSPALLLEDLAEEVEEGGVGAADEAPTNSGQQCEQPHVANSLDEGLTSGAPTQQGKAGRGDTLGGETPVQVAGESVTTHEEAHTSRQSRESPSYMLLLPPSAALQGLARGSQGGSAGFLTASPSTSSLKNLGSNSAVNTAENNGISSGLEVSFGPAPRDLVGGNFPNRRSGVAAGTSSSLVLPPVSAAQLAFSAAGAPLLQHPSIAAQSQQQEQQQQAEGPANASGAQAGSGWLDKSTLQVAAASSMLAVPPQMRRQAALVPVQEESAISFSRVQQRLLADMTAQAATPTSAWPAQPQADSVQHRSQVEPQQGQQSTDAGIQQRTFLRDHQQSPLSKEPSPPQHTLIQQLDQQSSYRDGKPHRMLLDHGPGHHHHHHDASTSAAALAGRNLNPNHTFSTTLDSTPAPVDLIPGLLSNIPRAASAGLRQPQEASTPSSSPQPHPASPHHHAPPSPSAEALAHSASAHAALVPANKHPNSGSRGASAQKLVHHLPATLPHGFQPAAQPMGSKALSGAGGGAGGGGAQAPASSQLTTSKQPAAAGGQPPSARSPAGSPDAGAWQHPHSPQQYGQGYTSHLAAKAASGNTHSMNQGFTAAGAHQASAHAGSTGFAGPVHAGSPGYVPARTRLDRRRSVEGYTLPPGPHFLQQQQGSEYSTEPSLHHAEGSCTENSWVEGLSELAGALGSGERDSAGGGPGLYSSGGLVPRSMNGDRPLQPQRGPSHKGHRSQQPSTGAASVQHCQGEMTGPSGPAPSGHAGAMHTPDLMAAAVTERFAQIIGPLLVPAGSAGLGEGVGPGSGFRHLLPLGLSEHHHHHAHLQKGALSFAAFGATSSGGVHSGGGGWGLLHTTGGTTGGGSSVHGGASNPHLNQHSQSVHHHDLLPVPSIPLQHAYTTSGPLAPHDQRHHHGRNAAGFHHARSSVLASQATQAGQATHPLDHSISSVATAGAHVHSTVSRDLQGSREGSAPAHQPPTQPATYILGPTGLTQVSAAHSTHYARKPATATSPFAAASQSEPTGFDAHTAATGKLQGSYDAPQLPTAAASSTAMGHTGSPYGSGTQQEPDMAQTQRTLRNGRSMGNSEKRRTRRNSLLSLLSGAIGVAVGNVSHKERGDDATPSDEQHQHQAGVDQPRRSPHNPVQLIQGMHRNRSSHTALDSLFTAGDNPTSHGPAGSTEWSGGLRAPSSSPGIVKTQQGFTVHGHHASMHGTPAGLDVPAGDLLNIAAQHAAAATIQNTSYAEKSYGALLRDMALGFDKQGDESLCVRTQASGAGSAVNALLRSPHGQQGHGHTQHEWR